MSYLPFWNTLQTIILTALMYAYYVLADSSKWLHLKYRYYNSIPL